jgi:primosomal replication protein N
MYMRTQTKLLAVALVAVGFLPGLAFAKNSEPIKHGLALGLMANHSSLITPMPLVKLRGNDNDQDNQPGHKQAVNGTVSATASTGFTLTDSKGTVWTINTANTTIITAFGQTLALDSITVGSHANVQGSVSGNTVTASRVVISPANTHPASGFGTVTAVNGSSLTLQLNNHGIISSATVSTNASTTVIQNGATTTTSAITVGSKISVKGLWDEVLNVLNAIKIKIF